MNTLEIKINIVFHRLYTYKTQSTSFENKVVSLSHLTLLKTVRLTKAFSSHSYSVDQRKNEKKNKTERHICMMWFCINLPYYLIHTKTTIEDYTSGIKVYPNMLPGKEDNNATHPSIDSDTFENVVSSLNEKLMCSMFAFVCCICFGLCLSDLSCISVHVRFGIYSICW